MIAACAHLPDLSLTNHCWTSSLVEVSIDFQHENPLSHIRVDSIKYGHVKNQLDDEFCLAIEYTPLHTHLT